MIGVEVSFTKAVEEFVAHAGPKFSYTTKALGDEFFVASHSLLFEQGVVQQQIEVEIWERLPVFFKTDEAAVIPYDVFAASFFMLSRYEEALPHIKTAEGHFDPSKSIAKQHDFLELPVVDLWVAKFQQILASHFEEFKLPKGSPPKKEILIEVPLAFRYKYRTLLEILMDFSSALWQLNIRGLVTQFLVLLRLKDDPYDSFDQWKTLFASGSIQPKIFFLFAKSSAYQSTISTFNLKYRQIIKQTGDFFALGVLASVKSQLIPDQNLSREKKDFQELTHRTVSNVRWSNGIKEVTKDYGTLSDFEFTSDYSMGYAHTLGFRAGTAIPFYFYDVSNEFQLPLKVHSVYATQKALTQKGDKQPFEILEKKYEALPLSNSKFTVVLTNGFLHSSSKNNTLQKGFQDYICD